LAVADVIEQRHVADILESSDELVRKDAWVAYVS